MGPAATVAHNGSDHAARADGMGADCPSRTERSAAATTTVTDRMVPPGVGLPYATFLRGRKPQRSSAFRLSSVSRSRGAAVLATFSIHTARGLSHRPSVVVMQAIENWDCHDTTASLGSSRHRLVLRRP